MKNWLNTWKPIHLCWLFRRLGLPVPRHFIGGAPRRASSPFTLSGSRIGNATRTWQAGEDVDIVDWLKTNDFIFAIAMEAGAHATASGTLQIRWRNKTEEGSFVALGASGEMKHGATDLVEGNPLTSGERGCTGSGTWIDGVEKEGDNDEPIDLGKAQWTELQFSISPADAQHGDEYEFELYDVTEGAAVGVCLATLTIIFVYYKLEGISKDKNGNALGSCLCFLCRDNQDNSCSYLTYMLSNSVTGAYSFTGLLDNDAKYFVISWKDDSPHVFDVTDHVLQPVLE